MAVVTAGESGAAPTGLDSDLMDAAAADKTAARFGSFVAAHDGSGSAVVSYLGRAGARIVVVAADGLFTDAVVPTVAAGVAVCEKAGIPVESWTRELTSRIATSPADRRRMAGTGR